MTTSQPTLQVLPVTVADIPQISDIHLRAWLTNPLYSTIYHSGYGPVLLAANVERHTTALQHDPSARYLKCVLAGRLIAWAKINVFGDAGAVEQRKDLGERVWPAGVNVGLIDLFWGQLQALRREYGPRLGPHVQVDLVATDPEYFKRGAGRALMREIVGLADGYADGGLPCFIEGSPDGEWLYASVGFVKVGEFSIDVGRFPDGKDLGEGWQKERSEGADKGWYTQFVMIRPAMGKSVEDYLGPGWEERKLERVL